MNNNFQFNVTIFFFFYNVVYTKIPCDAPKNPMGFTMNPLRFILNPMWFHTESFVIYRQDKSYRIPCDFIQNPLRFIQNLMWFCTYSLYKAKWKSHEDLYRIPCDSFWSLVIHIESHRILQNPIGSIQNPMGSIQNPMRFFDESPIIHKDYPCDSYRIPWDSIWISRGQR
jgi:hypothetical protein